MRLTDIKKVYVAEYKDMYKIGISHNVSDRICGLKTSCPSINLLYESNYIKNPFYVEKVLHEVFIKHKIAGEWFTDINISLLDKTVKEIGIIADLEKEKAKIQEENQKFEKKALYIINKISSYELKENDLINVTSLINLEKGWSFEEKDKDFLIKYFKDYAEILEKYCSNDGIEDVCLIINSLTKHGVKRTKELIQIHAINLVDAVNGEIYKYYNEENSKNILYLIENSLLLFCGWGYDQIKAFLETNTVKMIS